MCGLAGVFGDHIDQDPRFAHGVQQMLGKQIHRGPDDEGWLARGNLVLGHRRLSIVDLSPSGRQPMANEDGTVWIVYNGEIYNHRALRLELQGAGHRFSSTSDTEIIVHGYEEWGIDHLLLRLRGMFAFALHDERPTPQNPRLILARDRFGIKPLYYSRLPDRKGLVFASEVRALKDCGLVPLHDNPRAWLAFLLFGSVPAPWTTVRGIEILPPGHYLVLDESGLGLRRYFALVDHFKNPSLSSAPLSRRGESSETVEKNIRALLEESVALHLISDAPLGVFLSGGIDSSALVGLAASQKPDLVTLGVIFDEKGFSEEPYQDIVAKRFRTQHRRVLVTMADFRNELKRFIDAMDQPTVDGLNTYFVARAAKDVGLKAVLSGIGGDEIFCGYPTLGRAPHLWRLRALPAPLRAAAIALGSFRPAFKKLAFLRRNGDLPFYLVQRGLFTPAEAAELLGTSEQEAWAVIESLESRESPRDAVLLQQYLEARHYLVDQLLKDGDVFGMAHSVEIRVPFLDHVLAEAALRAPRRLHTNGRSPKPLLSGALGDLLPEQVVFRPKQGFTLPIEAWLRSGGRPEASGSGLNQKACREVWEAFLSGRSHWSRPWALTIMTHLRAKDGSSLSVV